MSPEQHHNGPIVALTCCLYLAALLVPTGCSYGQRQHHSHLSVVGSSSYTSSGSSLASNYENELLAAADAADTGYPNAYNNECVLTIKPYNSSSASSSSYSTALAATSDSYHSDYVSSGPREPYRYRGGSICITQHDVDAAVEEAKASLGGYVPNEIQTANSELPKPMQVSVVAQIITQATRILAKRFKLPEPAILYDLPSIDLSKSSSIGNICPVFLRPDVNCELTKYRTLTGFCNNLHYKSWGSTRSAMVRFLAPDYYDSISLPRRAYDGGPLPSARVVSFIVHQDPQENDQYHSMLGVVWGQFINHDINLAVRSSDENPDEKQIDCCKYEDSHPDCYPIEIPRGDPFYGYFNQKCMHFTRVVPGLQPGCSLGPVQALNKHSSYLDGSPVYGSGVKTITRLRTFEQGLLRSQPVSSASAYGSASPPAVTTLEYTGGDEASAPIYGMPSSGNSLTAEYLVASGSLQHQAQRRANGLDVAASSYSTSPEASASTYSPSDAPSAAPPPAYSSSPPTASAAYKELMPPNKHAPDAGCERRGRPKDVYCFDAGDARANEQISLATLQTLMLREHNRVARQLSYINPHWDDERLFQEARSIVIAQIQHITFNEFLPIVIGKEKIYEYELELERPGKYFDGYHPKINAGTRVEFQAAAFRYGHSIVPSYIERYNKFHQKIESIRLSKLLKQPYDLYHPGVMDSYILGLADQRSGRMDPTLTTEIANHLFEKPGKFFGLDLAAINIQRGRDMGVPGYNHFREYCGLPRARYFEDLTGVFSNKTLFRMAQLYKHVDDIDLFTAGISEYPVADGLVGPTFACLIARQFVNLRRGDRFWYENGGYQAQFTIEQLDELRKSTAARLMCDNSDSIETIQVSAMLIADQYTNPRVPCHALPSIDLTSWREQAPQTYSKTPGAYVPESDYHEHQGPAGAALEYEPQRAPMVPEQPESIAPIEYRSEKEAGSSHPSTIDSHSQRSPSIPGGPIGEYEPLKTTSHFVNHLVTLNNYRPEAGDSYQVEDKSS